jgi:dTDP-4-amino-4,6-dideoxygalactose transaminase
MNSPYEAVDAFEKKVAEYAGAKYGVAVNSCSNALFLSAVYRMMQGADNYVYIPKYTYVGVPYAFINAGCKVSFTDEKWKGIYLIYGHSDNDLSVGAHLLGFHEAEDLQVNIVDSARRFRKDMYIPNTLYCLSFHETKVLPIGDGGMILTDDKKAYDTLRKMRFDGRTPGKSVFDDTFDTPGYHCHMKPDVAIRGLMLMAGVNDYNEDLPEVYPDLSKIEYFRE